MPKESSNTRQCYQRGYLRCTHRKSGPDCWEFLWREDDLIGKRVRRTAVIGTVTEFPKVDSAQAAVNGLRMRINPNRGPRHELTIHCADLVDHYVQTELSDDADGYSHATRVVYLQFLKNGYNRTGPASISGMFGLWPLSIGGDGSNATKAKIRNLMSVLFNPAIRYEWLAQGRNPITLARQTAKRIRTPEVLEPREIQSLLLQLRPCFRLMVMVDVTTGLRRSEWFA